MLKLNHLIGFGASFAVPALPVTPALPTFWAGPSNSTTGTPLTTAVTIPAAANRMLIVAVAIPLRNATGATVDSVDLSGVPMIRLGADRILVDGANQNLLSLWYLIGPRVGAGNINVFRTTGTALRTLIGVTVFTNARQVAPTVIGELQDPVNRASYSLSASTTAANSAVLGVFSSNTSGTGRVITLAAGNDTEVSRIYPTGTAAFLALEYTPMDVAGADSSTWNVDIDLANVIYTKIQIEGAPPETYVPIYYVSPTGSDSNSGTSPATAMRTFASLASVVQPGDQVLLERGQRHRPASFAASRTLFQTITAGTSLNPIRIGTYGSGARPVLSGDVLVTAWSPVTSPEVFGNPNAASIEKMTSPPTLHGQQFPTAGDRMMYPAQWPLSSNDAVDYSSSGGGAFNFYDSTTFTARVTRTGTGPFTITITDPAIAARYGTNNLIGYRVVFARAGNQTGEGTITAYNSGTSTITFVAAGDAEVPGSSPTFYWAIRFHPLDIQRPGQYAWLLDVSNNLVNLCGWFTAGDRGVTHCDTIFSTNHSHYQFNDVDFQRVAAQTLTAGCSFISQPSSGGVTDNLSVTNFAMSQAYSPDRGAFISGNNVSSTGDDWIIRDGVMSEFWTNGGIRYNQANRLLVERVEQDGGGRTNLYLDWPGATLRDISGDNNQSVHGNGVATYQRSETSLIERASFMNCQNPIASQVGTPKVAGTPKTNIFRNIVASLARNVDGSTDGFYACRWDGGDVDTLVERSLLLNTSFWSSGAGPNTGMTIRRAVLGRAEFTSGGVNGMTFDRVLICATSGSVPNLAALTSAGATVTNCELDATQVWNGCPTLKMQRFMTWASGAPGSEVYEEVLIGPLSEDWRIPPFGTISAMVDLLLSRTQVFAQHQAGRTIGVVKRTRPGSSLSLPALGDNALFGLVNGYLFPVAALPGGTYSVVIRETNAAATNGPTRDTLLAIVAI